MIRWYINRLKTMSFFEVFYRFKQLIQKKRESFLNIKPAHETQIPETSSIFQISSLAIPVFDNYISVFGKKMDFLNTEIEWHKDIFSGESFKKVFSKDINIRGNPMLSAKNVWEPNRLQFLIHIASNYKLTKDEKYLKKFVELNESWIRENPYLIGVNWYSNIEVNIRLINWFFCWELLDLENLIEKYTFLKEFVNTKWIPCIYQHCKYSYNNPSKYSSANNHLISEYSGLYIASSLWKFKESKKWLMYAKNGLENEIKKQHSKGINKEEAAEYVQFITDLFLLPFLVAKKNKDYFSKTYMTVLKEVFDYIKAFTDININFPKYGDEDDGYVLNFSEKHHFNNFKSLLVSASIIFFDSNYLFNDAEYDVKNQLLFGTEGKITFDKLKKNKIRTQNSVFYPEEGHFIFKKQNKAKEIYAHFDVAPIGYLSIAAHGHSDILSFLININGTPFFIDPGTYSYHTEKHWRNYFVSSKAHNTITIDDSNQAYHAGDTMWLDHFEPEVISSSVYEDIECVVGTYNNKSKVQHIRLFQFDKNSNEFLVEDTIKIKDQKVHKIFLPFHIHPTVKITNNDNCNYILKSIDESIVELNLDSKFEWKTTIGSLDPLLGWYSNSFMKKEPSKVIFCEISSNKNLRFSTRIRVLSF